MANKKEEVIFKVKAELAGFKKSMEDLKKIAKDSSKNIEKAMNMDLTDEGSKAGKSFAKGMNKELKGFTDTLKKELKLMSEKTYNIKIKLDSSSVERVKRDLSNIEIRVSASASGRASLSMSNNANAPNVANTMSSVANTAALTRLASEVNRAANLIGSKVPKLDNDKVKVDTENVKIKVDTKDAKVGVDTDNVKINIPDVELKAPQIDPIEVNVDFATEKLEISAKNMADTISEAINNSIDSIKKAFESSANEIRKAVEATNKKPIGVVENVKRRTNPQQTEDLELSKAMIKKYEEEIQKLIELIAQLKALRKVRKNIESGTVGYKYVNDEIVKTESAIARVNSKIKEYKNYLGDNADNLSISFNRTNESINQLRMNLQLLANNQGGSFSKLKDSIKNAFSGIGNIANKGLSSAMNLVGNEVVKLGNRIANLGIKILNPINAFKVFTQTVKSTAKSIASSSWNGVVNGFNRIKQVAQSTATVVRSSMSNVASAVRAIPGAIRNIPNHLNRGIVGVGNSISRLGFKIKTFANDIPGNMKRVGNSIKSALSGAIEKSASLMGKLGTVMGNLLSKIKGGFSNFKRTSDGIRGMGNAASAASSKIGKLTGAFTGLLAKLGIFFGFYELFYLLKEGTKDAMKYEAAIMNLQRTFGKASQSLIDFANNQAVAFGISKKQVGEYGNIFSVIMKDANRAMSPSASANAIAKQTMDMSQGLLEAAGKISGALGYDTETVLEGLRSGLLGSSEAVDQYGLNLKVASLEQSKTFREVANGKKSWNDLTVAQQQYIIAQEIINQTTAKYGNMMRNTATLHSRFMAQWANTKLALGNLGKVIWTAILPALTQVLAVLERIFNYAASALTALLKLFNIDVTPINSSVDSSGLESGVGSVEETLGGLDDTASDTSDAIDGVGDSAKDTAKDTEEAAKKIKRALAGFDQINVLSLGSDDEDSGIDDEIPSLDDWNTTPIDGDLGDGILPELGDGTLNKLNELSDEMKAFIDEILTPFRAAWDLLGNRWKAAWADLVDSFKNHTAALSKFLKSVWENGGQEFVRHMAEIGLAVGIAAMEIGGTILDSLAKLWEHLDPETNANTQGFLDALNETAVKLRDLILDLNTHFESLMENGGQDVLNALGDMWMNLGEAAARGVGVVIDAIDGLLDHLDPANNDFTRGMLEAWENAFLSIGQMALSFADLLESALDNGLQEIINSLGDLGANLLGTVGIVIDECAKTLDELFQHLDPAKNQNSKDALASLDKFIDSINDLVSALAQAFQNFMDNGGREFVKNLGDIIMMIVDLAAAAGSGIIDIITGFINSFAGQALIEGAAKALEWFSDKLEGLKAIIEPLKDVFQDVVDFIVGIFEGDGEKVGRAFVSFIKNAFKVAGELSEFMAEIGEALILGLIEGIKALPGLLWEAAKFLFDVLVGAVKELFGIHSPSTVMAEFGGYIIEGLAEGLINTLSSIGDAIKRVYDFIIESFNGICEDIKGVLDKVKDIEIPSPKVIWDEAKRKVEDAVGKAKETVEKFKADLPKPSVVWDSVKTTAERTISNIKTSVEKFKANLPKPTLSWSDLKTTLTETLNKLKETISKFKWELPKPKLPSFSVSGGKAPWGFMGQGSLPKISIKWNAHGGIMNSPTIFGMTGNTLLGGGEAGAEAILPLDELWNRLDNSFQQQNQALSRAIASSNNSGSNRPVNVVLKVNDIEMGKVVVNSLKSLSNHSGGSLDLPFNK